MTLLVLVTALPMGYGGSVCDSVDSPDYWAAAGAKFLRGIGNVTLSWVEFFRQPIVNENKWEGVGRGILHSGVRAVAGALEVATAMIPGAKIPQLDPACPTDLVKVETAPEPA